MQPYNKEELTGKSIEELRTIADEFGIKTAELDEMGLVYEILDHSAVATAADKNATAKAATKKRTRIKTVDRVYTANQTKAKKVDKTVQRSIDDSLFASLSNEEQELMTQAQEQEKIAEQAVEMPVAEEAPATPKHGRKSTKAKADKSETATTENAQDSAQADATSEHNKEAKKDDFVVLEMENVDAETNGKKKRSTKKQQAQAEEAEAKSEEAKAEETPESAATSEPAAEAADDEPDFIILEDVPSEESVIGRNPLQFFNKQRASENLQKAEPSVSDTANDAPTKAKNYDFSDILTLTGVLEVVDNYGFLRSSDYNYLASPDDVYVNQSQVKHYGLKTGDVIEGTVRPPKDSEKFFVLVNIKKINGCDPTVVRDRISFEYLTPLFPEEKFKLCRGDGSDSHSSRIVDLFSPIGKGQRALIVAQPKTGKTLLMKDIANSIARNHPEAYLIMLLIDERPEEVTDMARTVNAEVIASTFDAPAENHVKIAGIVLEKAKRMVECGHDVVIFLDSITRLARAYNTVSPASGKVLSGGVDANALQKPKRFFGAARNIEGGGSLTIVATALIDTGSKMDEVIFEEFKGTGNMELQLDRSLANKRIFPAVNLIASSTRRDDLLHDQTTLNRMWILRKHIADMTPIEAIDLLKNYLERTKSNEELLLSMNG